jgi:hypothetical protein
MTMSQTPTHPPHDPLDDLPTQPRVAETRVKPVDDATRARLEQELAAAGLEQNVIQQILSRGLPIIQAVLLGA